MRRRARETRHWCTMTETQWARARRSLPVCRALHKTYKWPVIDRFSSIHPSPRHRFFFFKFFVNRHDDDGGPSDRGESNTYVHTPLYIRAITSRAKRTRWFRPSTSDRDLCASIVHIVSSINDASVKKRKEKDNPGVWKSFDREARIFLIFEYQSDRFVESSILSLSINYFLIHHGDIYHNQTVPIAYPRVIIHDESSPIAGRNGARAFKDQALRSPASKSESRVWRDDPDFLADRSRRMWTPYDFLYMYTHAIMIVSPFFVRDEHARVSRKYIGGSL